MEKTECEANGTFDQEILEQLDNFGFPRDYAVKCLQNNKHNHVTTTYYLLKAKRRCEGVNPVAADLDLEIPDDTPFLSVATPSRGARRQVDPSVSGRRIVHAWMEGESARPRNHDEADGGGRTPPAVPRRPDFGVPKLNLDDLARVSRDDGPRVASARSPARSPEAPPLRSNRQVKSTTPRDIPPPAPQSARHRGRQPEEPQVSGPSAPSRRVRPPRDWNYDRVKDSPREPPLSARPRLQGNSSRLRDRSAPMCGHQCRGWANPGRRRGSSPSGGLSCGGAGYGSMPLSARGAETRESPAAVSFNSMRPPQQIVQEIVHAVGIHRVYVQKVSGYLLRCQSAGVRFEAEVLQLDRGGHMLRFSHVSGDVWQFNELCSLLRSEMHL